jgi:dCMP deaminase
VSDPLTLPLLRTPRPGWQDYFLGIALAVSRRGDCCRCEVGAVLVDDRTNRILSVGYNGSPPGGPSCRQGDCARCLSDAPSGSGYEGCEEKHAEQNCYEHALKYITLFDFLHTTMYVTRQPCHFCVLDMQNLEIPRAIYLIDSSTDTTHGSCCASSSTGVHWEVMEL